MWYMKRELDEAKKFMSPAALRKLVRQQTAAAAAAAEGETKGK